MKRIIITGFCLLLFSASVGAQQTLTLEECRRMAMENNKQAAIADVNITKAEADMKSYRANYLPRLSATGMYYLSSGKTKLNIPGGYLPTFVPNPAGGGLLPNIVPGTEANPVFQQYAYMPDINMELKLNNTYIAGVQLEQPIYMGGKVGTAYRMSRIGRNISHKARELSRAEVIVEADRAYWTYVEVKELRESAVAYKKTLDELMRNVTNAFNEGMTVRKDVLTVQVKLNDAELQLRRAENAVRLARMNLCHVLGMPLHSDIDVAETFTHTEDLVLPSYDDITARPEYAMLSDQIELKQYEAKLARSEYLPEVGVKAGYNYLDGIRLNGDKLSSSGTFSAILSVNIPIFEWGAGRNKVRAARAEEQSARLQRQNLEEKMELEAARARNTLDEAMFETRMTARSLEQAEENMRVSRNMYDNGLETLADHLEAQALWHKAASDDVTARAKYELSKTEYLKAAGRL